MIVSIIRFVASVLLVLSIPVLLVASNLRWLALSPAQYEAGHSKYAVAKAMSVTPDQVRAISLAIIDYLQSTPDSLPALLAKHGASPSFFSERDMLHLIDVHGLVQMVFQTQMLSLALGILCLAIILLLYNKCRDEKVASRILWGGGLTMGALALIALVSFTNFDAVFLQFHFIAFSNDFWRLDPRTDRLILMFPPYFFYDMMLLASVLAFAQAAAITAVAGGFLFLKKRGRRRTIGYR